MGFRNTCLAGLAILGWSTLANGQGITSQLDARFASQVAQCSCSEACGCSSNSSSGCSCTGGCTSLFGCSGGAGCSGGGCTGGGCTGGGGSGIDVGGWLAFGTYDNSHGLDGQFGNFPLGFNNIAERPVLHQAWLYAGKEADRNGGLGFRADVMFGADGPDTTAFGDGGWDNSWTTSSQYGFAAPQLYGEIGFGGDTVVRVGRFYTLIGYETVQAPNNFFYSHAYTMYYNEPFTHTGVLVDKQIGDLTIWGGWTMGWDSGFENRNDGSTFLGGFSAPLTDATTLTYTTSFGDPGDNPLGGTDVFMNSVILDTALTDSVNHVLWGDFQTRRTAPGQAFKQYAVVNYLTKQINDKVAVGMRHEWFYAGDGGIVQSVGGAPAGGGAHFHDLTLGMNYQVRNNIMIKPEVRYDWIDSEFIDRFGAVFDGATRQSQFTWGAQAVVTF